VGRRGRSSPSEGNLAHGGPRTKDAIAEIHAFGSRQYLWVFEADIAACFDELAHSVVLDRVRLRIADKRVLALIKRLSSKRV
jgi:retron-type reverse transcriptase